MKIYEKIRELREVNNWTQEQMAEKLNLSITGYAKIEQGKTRLTLERLEQLSELFNIDIIDFIKNENDIYFQYNENGTNHQGNIYNLYDNEKEYQHKIDKLSMIVEQQQQMLTLMMQQIDELKEMNLPSYSHKN